MSPQVARISRFCLQGFLVTLFLGGAIECLAARLVNQTVIADGHPLTVWSKEIEHPVAGILLLHGRTWSALPDFDLQVDGENLSFMDGLNDLGYSVWALDARGYGATPRDASGWLTPDRAAKDVISVLGWLQDQTGDRIHLFGWSYGSMVAQLVGQINSGSVKSVILFGYPLSPTYKFAAVAPDQVPPRIANTEKNAASDFITPGSVSAQAINAYVEQSLKADPIRVDWRELEQWYQLDARKLNVPTLLLQAQFDPLAKTESYASTFMDIPNPDKQWVMLAGGDHAALLEKPRLKMLHAINAFILWLDR